MTDQDAGSIIDLDAGQGFGKEALKLLRPFRFKGTVYREVAFRVPTGLDVNKHVNARTGVVDAVGLMCDLSELTEDVFDAMYAGDRNRVDQAVGKHLAGAPATSTTSSPTSASASPGTTTAS